MTSDNHSCDTQACPARVKEKGSEWGTWPVSTIHCPVRRCHQRSGSRALRAVMANNPNSNTTANMLDRERRFAFTLSDHTPNSKLFQLDSGNPFVLFPAER